MDRSCVAVRQEYFLRFRRSSEITKGKSMQTIAAVIRQAEAWLGQASVTAVYPCSGFDTRAFTFLHPDFLGHRNASTCPGPNLFVYIDNEKFLPSEQSCFDFDDARTRVDVVSSQKIELQGIAATLNLVSHKSLAAPEWCRTPDRRVAVLFLRSDWEKTPGLFLRSGFVPDVFIGVTDGCGFGGNRSCVNRLDSMALPDELLRSIPLPRHFVTDHFENAEVPNPLETGGMVRSMDRRLPFAFRKIALLSSQWGRYGSGPVGGATLFERVDA